MSGFLIIYKIMMNLRWTSPGDIFSNVDRIKKVNCQVCIIHSIKHEIILFYHVKESYKNVKNKFALLTIDNK